ncbi:MAG: zinc ribbon domain-containing protein [Ruminococcus sp.]|nr:zinc ribbon domain-containing protein [Ruminococcus sp.]
MNDFMEKYFKKIAKGIAIFLGIMVIIGAGLGINAMRHSLSVAYAGNTSFYTFLLVLYWIAVGLAIACIILKIAAKYMGNSAPAQNTYTAPQQAVPQPMPQQAAEKFCPNCGNKVPAENQFCNNCGSKIS